MTAHRQFVTSTAEPDTSMLTREQLQGWNCALCDARLTVDRPAVTIALGPTQTTYEVWACAPACGIRLQTERRCVTGNELYRTAREAARTGDTQPPAEQTPRAAPGQGEIGTGNDCGAKPGSEATRAGRGGPQRRSNKR